MSIKQRYRDIYYVLRDAVSATKVKVRTTIWAAASTIIDINEIIRVFPPSLPEARIDFLYIYFFFYVLDARGSMKGCLQNH